MKSRYQHETKYKWMQLKSLINTSVNMILPSKEKTGWWGGFKLINKYLLRLTMCWYYDRCSGNINEHISKFVGHR